MVHRAPCDSLCACSPLIFFASSLRQILLIVGILAGGSAADVNSPDVVIRAILQIQGVESSTRKAMVAQLEAARKKHTDLPASTWNEVEAQIHGPALARELGAVWKSLYTEKELKELLAFLRTSTGRKFLLNMQVLQARSGAAAGLWGMDVYAILQTKHADRFPVDRARDQNLRKLLTDALGNGAKK